MPSPNFLDFFKDVVSPPKPPAEGGTAMQRTRQMGFVNDPATGLPFYMGLEEWEKGAITGAEQLKYTIPRGLATMEMSLSQVLPDMYILPGLRESLQESAKARMPELIAKEEQLWKKQQDIIKERPELAPKEGFDQPILSGLQDPKLKGQRTEFITYQIGVGIVPTIAAMLAGVGATFATGSPVTGALASAAVMVPMEHSDVYRAVLDAGATPEKAAEIAGLVTPAIAAVEYMSDIVALDKLTGGSLSDLIKKEASITIGRLVAKGVVDFATMEATEIAEEVVQQIIQNAAVKCVDENKSLIEGLDETAVQTAFTMLPLAGVGTGVQMVRAGQQGVDVSAVQTAIEEERGGLKVTPPTEPTAPALPERRVIPLPTINEPIARIAPEMTIGLPKVELEVLQSIAKDDPAVAAAMEANRKGIEDPTKSSAEILQDIADMAPSLLKHMDRFGITLKEPSMWNKLARKSPVVSWILDHVDRKHAIRDPITSVWLAKQWLEDEKAGRVAQALAPLQETIQRKGNLDKWSDKDGLVDLNVFVPLNPPKDSSGRILRHIMEVISYAEEYTIPAEIREQVDEARRVMREAAQMLENYFGDVPWLARNKKESDWVFLHRVSKMVGDYIVTNPRRPGNITEGLKYETMEEGMAADVPVTYSKDLGEVVSIGLSSAYQLIINKEADRLVQEYTRSGKGKAPPRYYAAYDSAQKKFKLLNEIMGAVTHKGRVTSLLTQLGEGRKKLAPGTMKRVGEMFPELYDQLVLLQQMYPPNLPIDEWEKSQVEDYPQVWSDRRKTAQRIKKDMQPVFQRIKEDRNYALKALNYQRELFSKPGMEEAYADASRGRVFVPTIFQGRKITGRELAAKANDLFSPQRGRGVYEKVATFVTDKIAAPMQSIRLAYDISPMFLQTLWTAGLDVWNIAAAPARLFRGVPANVTASHAIGVARSIQSYFDHNATNQWRARPDIKAAQEEMAHYSPVCLVAPDIFRGTSTVEKFVSHIPLAGRHAQGFLRRISTVASELTEIIATNMWIGERARAIYGVTDPVKIDQRLQELGRMVALNSGKVSFRRYGLSYTQQQLGRLMMAGSMYNRSKLDYANMLIKGGVEGRIARESMAGLTAALVGTYIAVAFAMGIKPKLNPLPKSEGGDGAEFMSVPIGRYNVGVGAIVYEWSRFLANVATTGLNNPEDLVAPFDKGNPNMSNPFIRYFRAKSSIFVGTILDLSTGRDYIGQLTRNDLNAWVRTLGRAVTPLWADELIKALQEGTASWDTGVATVGEWTGGRVFPESDLDKARTLRDQLAQDYTKGEKLWDELNQGEQNELTRKYPDLDRWNRYIQQQQADQGDRDEAAFFTAKTTAKQKRDINMNIIAQAYLDGELTEWQYTQKRNVIRPEYSIISSLVYNLEGVISPQDRRRSENWWDRHALPEEKAYSDFWDYYWSLPEANDIMGDYEKLQEKIDKYLANNPHKTYIEQMRNDWIKDLPEPARTVELERQAKIESGEWGRGTTRRPTVVFK